MRHHTPPPYPPLVAGFRRLAICTLAALSLFAVGCGARLPTTTEATEALSGATASTLTRTVPASTYCMTANPDFSFATTGQVDLVEMFQNLSNKAPLLDATLAGAVRVELKEFRFDPSGRSPDPSCDAVHTQSRQSGYTSSQIRLAVVRTTLTPKGTAAGVQFDTPIEVATREVVDISNIQTERGGAVAVTYTWHWKATPMAEVIGYTAPPPQEATARLRQSDTGWVVEDAGLK